MYLDLSFGAQGATLAQADLPMVGRRKPKTTQITLPRLAEDEDEIIISMVTSDAQRDEASALINRMYEWRGYGTHHRLAARAQQTTFTVSTGGATIGTLTLTVDSEAGLTTDVTFRDELNTYRRVPGASICELTRFAFDAANPSKRLLASLFHVIFIYGQRKFGCTDLFIEVAQRHRRFYEMMLGFERVCALKTNDNVGVPSQLMRLNVADIQSHIDAHAGSQDTSSSRSLYPHFFSKAEADRIYAELAEAIHADAPTEKREYIAFEVVADEHGYSADQAPPLASHYRPTRAR